MSIRPFSLLPLLAGTALAACGDKAPAPDARTELDPAIVAALADPIMIDPDLASQNRGNAAITLDRFDAVPLEDNSPEATEAAKADASRLSGGMIRTAPEPSESAAELAPALTAGQVAAALPAVPASCLRQLRYGYDWAASFPRTVPIYPRGHVQEAAGTNAPGCALQAVVFVTPVEPSAVIDFYHTRTGDSGYRTVRSRHAGGTDVLSGSKASSAFVVRVRQGDGGLSEVELAIRG